MIILYWWQLALMLYGVGLIVSAWFFIITAMGNKGEYSRTVLGMFIDALFTILYPIYIVVATLAIIIGKIYVGGHRGNKKWKN